MSSEDITTYIQEGKTPEERLERHNEIYRYGASLAGLKVEEPIASGELILSL